MPANKLDQVSCGDRAGNKQRNRGDRQPAVRSPGHSAQTESKFPGLEQSKDQMMGPGSSIKIHSGWDQFAKSAWDERDSW